MSRYRVLPEILFTVCMLISSCSSDSTSSSDMRKSKDAGQKPRQSIDNSSNNSFEKKPSRINFFEQFLTSTQKIEASSWTFENIANRSLKEQIDQENYYYNEDDKLKSGYCILVAKSDTSLASSDFSDRSAVEIAVNNRIAYSRKNNMQSQGCQDFFKKIMPTRYKKDFFKFSVSYFPDYADVK